MMSDDESDALCRGFHAQSYDAHHLSTIHAFLTFSTWMPVAIVQGADRVRV